MNNTLKNRSIQTLCCLLLCFLLFPIEGKAQDKIYHLKTIVIDAGHGGKDPGALGKHNREKHIVLGIALKLGKYIHQNYPNIKIIYTRKTDVFIPLRERSAIANRNNADLFISIHANANNNKKIYGTETYTLGLHRTQENLEVAMKENAVIEYEDDYSTKYEGFDPKNPASYIIFNMMQSVNRDKSIAMAQFTEQQFKERVGRNSRGVREAGFWVLKQVSCPSVLIEVGFVTNLNEERFLTSKKGQDYMASAIYRAFKNYKQKIDELNNVILAQKKENQQKSTTKQKINPKNNYPLFEYCVQIKSSNKKLSLNSKCFKGLQSIRERKINGQYKYTIGSTKSYAQINKLRRKTRKKIKDCFIVAFYKGERISLPKARRIKNKQ